MNRVDYERMVEQHMDRVHSYAVWMLHDMEEARDVTQEALIRLWTHRRAVRAESVGPWLLKTAHRLVIDRLRRRTRRADLGESRLATLVDEQRPGPERLAGGSELGRRIGRALSRLPDRDRSIVLMREVHGATYEEIAKAVDRPLGTVKAALHRARERLRRELKSARVTP